MNVGTMTGPIVIAADTHLHLLAGKRFYMIRNDNRCDLVGLSGFMRWLERLETETMQTVIRGSWGTPLEIRKPAQLILLGDYFALKPLVRRLMYRGPDRLTLVRTMTTVTVSSKFQVVIPEDVRSRLKLQPGQKVIVIEKDGVVHMIPLKPVKETRGIARGITAQNVREELDRF
jgi:AbrB family looped-hinge helix DNA binding protein